MQEVIEKIIESFSKIHRVVENDEDLEWNRAVWKCTEIVEHVVAEYVTDNNVGNNGWIPCSERLPSKEEYLKDDGRFMLDDGNRRYQGLFDIYDGKFKFAKHISGLHYELFEDNCVIAWQPLPEPYQPKGE